jgi:Tfp pilus assembly protein FimT
MLRRPLLFLALVAVVAVLVVPLLPDVIRYLRIRSM